jgi:hypothetical protein
MVSLCRLALVLRQGSWQISWGNELKNWRKVKSKRSAKKKRCGSPDSLPAPQPGTLGPDTLLDTVRVKVPCKGLHPFVILSSLRESMRVILLRGTKHESNFVETECQAVCLVWITTVNSCLENFTPQQWNQWKIVSLWDRRKNIKVKSWMSVLSLKLVFLPERTSNAVMLVLWIHSE